MIKYFKNQKVVRFNKDLSLSIENKAVIKVLDKYEKRYSVYNLNLEQKMLSLQIEIEECINKLVLEESLKNKEELKTKETLFESFNLQYQFNKISLKNIEYCKEAYKQEHYIILVKGDSERIFNSLYDEEIMIYVIQGYKFKNKKYYNKWKILEVEELKQLS